MAGFWWAGPSGSSSQAPRSNVPHLPLVFCRLPVVSECLFHRSLNTGQINDIVRYDNKQTLYNDVSLYFDSDHFKKIVWCLGESLPGTSQLWPTEVGTLALHRAAGLQGSWKGKRYQAAPGCCHLPTAVCTVPAYFDIPHYSSGSTAATKLHKCYISNMS